MNLRSGHPYWLLKNGLMAEYPALKADARAEVAIIGGGITGALVADALTEAGMDCLLVDKRDIGTGSTAASTSILQYEIDTPLAELIGKVGEEHAVRAYRLGLEAIDRIEALTTELKDDCGFERRDSWYMASKPRHVAALREEFEARRRHGFSVELLNEDEVRARSTLGAPAAIVSHGNARIDAYRLTHLLIQRAMRGGLRVYDRTDVLKFEHTDDGTLLETDRGVSITARKVIVAAGYESQTYLKQNVGNLNSTFAVASEPLDSFVGWPDRAIVWETARPYFYLRDTPDGRAIIGGVDHPFSTAHRRDRLVERRTRRLVRKFQSLFPAIDFEVSYAWAGTFGETKDGLAYIGQTPERPDTYFALGYGGNGITWSVIAARIITDLYLGRPNPDAAIFRFDR